MNKLFKLNTGEMILTEIETLADGNYALTYPAVIIPIPAEQAGGQQNQIGFGKFMPFSDSKEDIILNVKNIMVESSADKKLVEAYKNWQQQVRSQESGIILPGMNLPKQAQASDFRKLNTGR